jgi:hypothetical protein
MLPRGGRATDDTTRGVEAKGAARGELEADDSTRVGGRTTRGKRAADDRTTQQEGGAHDVVGGGGDDGNCGGDSGGGGWSSEVGGAPTSMPGTAALATAPASGGVDDADDAPMAVGGRRRRGGGELRRRRWRGRRLGWAAGNDGATAAAVRPSPRYDVDCANRGAGSDDAPLADGRRKKIRIFFAKSFLIGTLRKVVKYTWNYIINI